MLKKERKAEKRMENKFIRWPTFIKIIYKHSKFALKYIYYYILNIYYVINAFLTIYTHYCKIVYFLCTCLCKF